jgi:aspartyl-tRNA synthetase
MKFVALESLRGSGFQVIDSAPFMRGIVVKGLEEKFTNKEINELTEWVKRPQIGAKGMMYIRYSPDGVKSSILKFYSEEKLREIGHSAGASTGDVVLILTGEKEAVLKQLGELRLEVARRFELIPKSVFKPLWVLDFPLVEWDEESGRFFAMHHPFTSPLPQDMHKMESTDRNTLLSIRAAAYDMVINGAELGGGSIRIHDRTLQEKNFQLLGFTKEEAERQFGFLMGAFEHGAPPHGGIAFGLDRVCAIMQGSTSIRDYIAFPKNNQGRDMMIDAPSEIDPKQLKELGI